jgi:hypothetical protein
VRATFCAGAIVGLALAAACAAAPPPPSAQPEQPVAAALGGGEGAEPLVLEGGAPEGGSDGAPATSIGVSSGPPITVVARSVHASAAIAVDNNAIYWVDEVGGEVARAPKRGGLTMTLFEAAGTTFSPGSSIAVDSGDVYWIADTEQGATRQSALRRLEKNGGKPTTIASSTTGRIYGLSFDETNVYWVTGGAVMRAPKTGAGTPSGLAAGLTGADSVAVDDTDAYVTLAGTEAKQFADGALVSIPRKGGAPRVRVASSARAANVLLDAKNVYWQAASGVMKLGKSGGAPVALATPDATIDDLALDDAYVYFATHKSESDGTIARVPKEGGPVEVLASGLTPPGGIAVDTTTVYWTCLGTEAKKYADATVSKRDKQ